MARTTAKTVTRGKHAAAHRSTARSESLPEESFWVNNGPVCCSIAELREAIKEMSDEQYAYHTRRDGNDFARWLSESLGHHECAQKLSRAKTRAGAVRALASCRD